MKLGSPITLAATAVVLAACAADPPDKMLGSGPCAFGARKKPVVIGYVARSGTPFLGDIPVAEYEKFPRRVATSVAAPRSKSYRLRVPKDCYNKKGDYYYSCPRLVEIDLSSIRGIARAKSVDRSNPLARYLCERQVQEVLAKQTGYAMESTKLKCRIVRQQACALDMAKYRSLKTKKPPAKKKE